MKKLFTLAIVLASFLSTSAYATADEPVKRNIEIAFQKEFPGASFVHWERVKTEPIYHAYFQLNGQRLNAYYSEEGDLLAIGRFIAAHQIPLLVTKAVHARYGMYKQSEAIEYIAGGETSYIVKVETDRAVLQVQAYPDGTTTVLKKERKK